MSSPVTPWQCFKSPINRGINGRRACHCSRRSSDDSKARWHKRNREPFEVDMDLDDIEKGTYPTFYAERNRRTAFCHA